MSNTTSVFFICPVLLKKEKKKGVGGGRVKRETPLAIPPHTAVP